jgi:undecaprenyl-diphosphatase
MEIFIQMGAILAVVSFYWKELRDLALRAPRQRGARDLVLKVGLAFVPAAALGFVAHHAIEEHLFTPRTVALALIGGGVVILVVERMALRFTTDRIERTTWRQALAIGVAQMASLVPGVSRAGATIVGGLLAGLDRPTATQFSFYLALPTVSAASVYSLVKGLRFLTAADVLPLAVGFVAAYVSALLVIRSFLAYVRVQDFRAFGWYRIALGAIVWAILARG